MDNYFDENPEADSIFDKKMPKAKQQFINKLKSYLYKFNGDLIFDRVILINGEDFEVNKFVASVDLDIDLINMIHYDQFLGDNFI